MTNLRYAAAATALAASLLSLGPAATPADAATATGDAAIARDVAAILAAPELQMGIDGAMVADARSGRVIYARHPDTLLVPASNRKLFTAAAALALLGPDRVERTSVVAASRPAADGTLDGSLYLCGGGDPLLSAADLAALAKRVRASGVTHVTGGVVGDGSLFSGSVWGDGWQVDTLLDYYAPEISALEVDEGIATVTLRGAARAGAAATFTAEPQTSYYTIDDQVTTGPPGSAVATTLTRGLTSTRVTITGSVPVDAMPDPTDDDTDGRITLPDQPLCAATILTEACRAAGIVIDGAPSVGPRPAQAALLAFHVSLPMAQLIARMLKPSDNLIAETLVRLDAVHAGRPGDYVHGAAAEDAYLATIGIGPQSHLFADGSGVSRDDFVTPRAVLKLLVHEADDPRFATFYDAMSIVGVDGTAKNRMRGTLAAGNARVKTGTVRNCRSLSGYVTTRSGRLLAFVILMNNHLLPARRLGGYQDRIVERLAAGE